MAKGIKTGGRVEGTPNRSTAEMKTAFQNILDCNVEQIGSDLKTLSPKDRINVLLKLADFVLPKIQSVQPEGEGFDNKIIIEVVDSNGNVIER